MPKLSRYFKLKQCQSLCLSVDLSIPSYSLGYLGVLLFRRFIVWLSAYGSSLSSTGIKTGEASSFALEIVIFFLVQSYSSNFGRILPADQWNCFTQHPEAFIYLLTSKNISSCLTEKNREHSWKWTRPLLNWFKFICTGEFKFTRLIKICFSYVKASFLLLIISL